MGMVVTMDFLATIMDVLNVTRPHSQRKWGFDGTSVMPLLRGESFPERGMGWVFAGYNSSSNNHGFRYGKWKYVERTRSCTNPDCEKPLLYNLHLDLSEKNDLSAKYPNILAAIKKNFTIWYQSVMKSYLNESKCPIHVQPKNNWHMLEI